MVNSKFDEFLKSIESLDHQEMIDDTREELKSAQAGMGKNGTPGSKAYVDNLHGLLIWLEFGRKLSGMKPENFNKFKPICERLVRKGQKKPDALKDFKQENSQRTPFPSA